MDVLPYSLHSGNITTADGNVYDMSSPASRQQSADANSVLWANSVAAAVRGSAPAAQVTVGLFTFAAVGKSGPNGMMPEGSDPRVPLRPFSLSTYSSLHFLDVHVYPLGAGFSLAADLQSSEWPLVDFTRMPVLMGEFGTFKKFYSTLPLATAVALDTQIASCQFNFSVGWLFWTWDSDSTLEQPELWSMMDGNGSIAQALSPAYRPNPCVS